MPDWLPSVLVQFPIVLLMGLLAYYAYNRIKEANAQTLRRDDAHNEARRAEARESQATLLAEKLERHEELRELTDTLTAELKRLADAVETLSRKRT